jgi:hypothetical protein
MHRFRIELLPHVLLLDFVTPSPTKKSLALAVNMVLIFHFWDNGI